MITFVTERLDEAGATLLALPNVGFSTAARTFWPSVLHEVAEAYGYTEETTRPAVPSAAAISRMDEALAWISLIPPDRIVLRRIVGARALVSPLTGRHVFTWRRLGRMVGADHRAVERWHAQGIRLIAAALDRGNLIDGPAQSARILP